MVQVQKEEVREALLEAARIEFLEKGFSGGSLRAIARRAGQNPGNIYNYFRNKDDLFYQLVEPTLEAIETGLRVVGQWKPSKEHPIYTMEDERAAIHIIIDYMDRNREEVRLLAFKAQGSAYENWFNQTTRQVAELFRDAVVAIIEYNPEVYKTEPSEFFTLNLIRFFYNGLLSMLKYGMSRQEMLEKSEELLVFYYTGLLELMRKP